MIPPALVAAVISLMCFALCAHVQGTTAVGHPRLCGIVNVGGMRRAIIEVCSEKSGRIVHLDLPEGARNEGITVLRILPTNGSVTISQDKNIIESTLIMGNHTDGGTAPALILDNAPLDSFLGIYGEIANRTLLRSPRLSQRPFTLAVTSTNASVALSAMRGALAERGITIIPDGDKFEMLVTREEAGNVKPRSSDIATTSGMSSEVLSPGVIYFPETDVQHVLAIYSELVGRKWDRSAAPTRHRIKLRNLTPLTRSETIYAIETSLELAGVKIVAVGDAQFAVIPSESAGGAAR